MRKIVSRSVQMNKGDIFDGDKINELIEHIVNKFADEKLSLEKAIIVLDRTREVIGEFAIVQHVD